MWVVAGRGKKPLPPGGAKRKRAGKRRLDLTAKSVVAELSAQDARSCDLAKVQ